MELFNLPVTGPAGRERAAFAVGLEAFGERTALVTEDGVRMSYAELARRADAFSAGLGAGRRLVLIEASNEVDPIVALLGALRGGHCAVLCGAGAIRTSIATTYAPDVLVAKVDGAWTTTVQTAAKHRLHPDLALLLSTSGSTGSAKLVRLSHGALDANARSIAEYLQIDPDERPITSLPIHYSYGLSVLTSHLSQGAAVLLTDRSVVDAEFWRFFEREGATSLAGVPYTYELLDRAGFMDVARPTLRTMTQAGGRLPPETAKRYAAWSQARGVKFYVMYGQTEATARMAYMPPDLLAENPGGIGVAIPGGAFRLLAEDGTELGGPGAVGELSYRGPNVMMGYALKPEDLAKGPELAELVTGDIAAVDASGLYRIIGRKTRFSKLYGLRIGLDEVEAALSGEGVKARVAGDDELIAVAVIGATGEHRLAERLAGRLGIPEALIDVACVDDPPLLASGKTDYRAILEDARRRRADVDAKPPSGEISVADAFARTFPGRELASEDTFASLGGDSLSYVNLALDLEGCLGALPADWADLSIAELEARSEQAAPSALGAWRVRKIESEVVIRAAAITLVVVNHASDVPVGGGADVLLLLAGYNMARYQRLKLISEGRWAVLGAFLRKVILPYYAILAAYLVWKRSFDIPSLLLSANFFGRFGSLLEPFWFLEAMAQITLLMVLLFATPLVRRSAERDPWRFSLLLLGVAVAVKVAVFALAHHESLGDRTPDALFYLVAFGWCLQLAKTTARKLIATGLCAVLALLEFTGAPNTWMAFPYPHNLTHAISLFVATGLILWLPRVPLPNWLRTCVAGIAAGSFYIYLTHGVPVHILLYQLHVHDLPLTIAMSLAVGLAAAALIPHADKALLRAWPPVKRTLARLIPIGLPRLRALRFATLFGRGG